MFVILVNLPVQSFITSKILNFIWEDTNYFLGGKERNSNADPEISKLKLFAYMKMLLMIHV